MFFNNNEVINMFKLIIFCLLTTWVVVWVTVQLGFPWWTTTLTCVFFDGWIIIDAIEEDHIRRSQRKLNSDLAAALSRDIQIKLNQKQ